MKRNASAYRSGPIVWSSVLLTTCLILFLFEKILWLVVPFLLAVIIYYLLLPSKIKLVLRGLPHDSAANVMGLSAILLSLLLAIFVLPGVISSAANWPSVSGRFIEAGIRLLTDSLRELEQGGGLLAQLHASEQLTIKIAEFSGEFAEKYLPKIALTAASWAPTLLLAPFIAFFMLRDGWRFRKFLGRAVPNAYFERSLYLVDQVDRTARLYFIGLIQLTVLDTVCLAFGLWVIGVDGAFWLGLAAAVMAWVPFVGSVAGCILVVLVAATDFPGQPGMAYAAVLLFVFVRLLDDFIFMPMTIGKSLRMHPLLTVLMIFIGGAVAGVAGLMLVLPVLGVTMVFGETLGQVLSDSRLRARHRHARQLRQKLVTADLRD